jgi:cell division septum initiation protein DivIVA
MKHEPTKSEELAAVRALAVQLGTNSYLGPWLAQRHAELAALVTSDIFPEITLADSQREAARIRQDARNDAERIMEAAHKQAATTIDQAKRQAEQITDSATARAARIRADFGARIRQAQSALAEVLTA